MLSNLLKELETHFDKIELINVKFTNKIFYIECSLCQNTDPGIRHSNEKRGRLQGHKDLRCEPSLRDYFRPNRRAGYNHRLRHGFL